MAARPATTLKALKAFALSLPGTQPKSPWPGHDDVAVNDKTFLYLLHGEDGSVAVGAKLPVTGKAVLRLPNAAPMAYGLGKSGWVRVTFEGAIDVPLEQLKRWAFESYRAQAPKRMLKALEAEQPWVAAGELPRL